MEKTWNFPFKTLRFFPFQNSTREDGEKATKTSCNVRNVSLFHTIHIPYYYYYYHINMVILAQADKHFH